MSSEPITQKEKMIVNTLTRIYSKEKLESELQQYLKYPKPTTPKARENATNSLRRLAQVAKSKGITIGLEPVNRYESNLLNTGRQALDMIEAIGEDNVKVHLDIYHMNIEEQDLVSPVIECGDKLGYVHIGASHRGPLGTGNVDFDSFFGALEIGRAHV